MIRYVSGFFCFVFFKPDVPPVTNGFCKGTFLLLKFHGELNGGRGIKI